MSERTDVKRQLTMTTEAATRLISRLEMDNLDLASRMDVMENRLEDYRDLFADLAKEYSENLCKKASTDSFLLSTHSPFDIPEWEKPISSDK